MTQDKKKLSSPWKQYPILPTHKNDVLVRRPVTEIYDKEENGEIQYFLASYIGYNVWQLTFSDVLDSGEYYSWWDINHTSPILPTDSWMDIPKGEEEE